MAETLYRPRDGRMLAGVCVGLARRFGWSPALVRLIFILFLFLPGSSILAYLILWIIMPNEPAGGTVGGTGGYSAPPA
jgi:phage shock protein PspC (stress-responsive transcriptional regulator)